jgi:hypothetical protein
MQHRGVPLNDRGRPQHACLIPWQPLTVESQIS